MRNNFAVALLALVLADASSTMAQGADSAVPEALQSLATASYDANQETFSRTGTSSAQESLVDYRFVPKPDDKPANTALVEISASNQNSRATLKFAHTTNKSGFKDNATTNQTDFTNEIESYSLILSAPVDKADTSASVLPIGTLPTDFQAKFGYTWYKGYMRVTRPQAQAPVSSPAGVPQNSLEGWAYTSGFAATVGYSQFDYYTVAMPTKSSTTDLPWSAQAFFGYVRSKDALLMLAGIEYQDAFTAGKAGTLCPVPSPTPPVLTCVTGALSAPKETKKLFTSLEFRDQIALDQHPLTQPLADFGFKSLGFDAKFAYDVKNDVYGFNLPITFASDEKNTLSGGVQFGWSSDKHSFIAGLFIGAPFTLFQ
jgi:hypothetical protein